MLKILIFILILLLYLGGNYYVVSVISQMLPSHSCMKIGLTVFVALGVASFFVYMMFHDELPYKVSKLLFMAGTTWMTFFLYLFLLTLLTSLLLFINQFLPLFSHSTLIHYTRENPLSLSLALAMVSMLLLGGYFNYLWTKRVEIPIGLTKELSSGSHRRDSIKVVALSDLHLGYSIGAQELEKWVRLINKEQPDMVILAGDIVDISTKPLESDSLERYFKEIKAPLGIYACVGNHEYYAGINKSIEFFKRANIQLLRDSSALVDSTLYVVGRDDHTNRNRKSVQQLIAGLDHSKPIILLEHQPANLDESVRNNIDLQFSGHTHSGQIWPISLLTKKIYEKSHGYLKKKNTNIYISSGIGIWGGKFRIGTQSEFVVFNIKGKANQESNK